MTRTEAYLALNLLPKIGAGAGAQVRSKRSARRSGCSRPKRTDIERVEGFGRDLAQTIAGWESRIDLARELRRIQRWS